jgi:AcrR family transcriptional regulator
MWYMYQMVHMNASIPGVAPGQDRTGSRDRLLAAAMDHVAQHGVGDLSLRGLAAALGTSHRMLSYHFGSREGLLVEVIRAVEAQQRAALAEMLLDADASPVGTMRRMWRRLADPALWPNERLFFEIYVQALQGSPPALPLLDGIVDLWVDPLTRIAVAQGRPEAEARAEARLGVAVTRGLLLDLLATGNREAVDAAMERYIAALAPAGTRPPATEEAPEQPPVARRSTRGGSA